jgi:CelD/BcsL family acetyltransferase involved in cellulose biosynthesis
MRLPDYERTTELIDNSIDVFTKMEDARNDWLALSREAVISPYQSYAFLSAWLDTAGRADGVEPFVIVSRDAEGRPNALLPFCVMDRKIRIALFMGGRESNFNLPLLPPNAGHDSASMRALLNRAARHAPSGPDLYYLRNQPRRFVNFENPLVDNTDQKSVSFAYGTTLPASAEELAARFSSDTRKKLRRKEARLAELGPVAYDHCANGARGAAIVDALIRQKSERFGVGAAFLRCDMPKFLNTLRDTAEDGGVELHALRVGERIVATYVGVMRGRRFSAMLNSFEQDEAIARCSPGDLLLHALMRHLVARGTTHFDLGAGEARYKSSVCNETIELYNAILPVTARGFLAAPMLTAYLRLKRRVKRTPSLINAYQRLRATLSA